ncbi:MAG: hypothetical protein N2116_02380 [Armatimonadetes bacterium]|nr:hypothetical protein [Armatimonadota bacterium]
MPRSAFQTGTIAFPLRKTRQSQNTRSLRFFNPQNGTWFIIQSFAYTLPSSKPYTFSVYLRADRNDFPVTLSIGYDKSITVKVSTDWQRFVFTATPRRGHWRRGRLAVSIAFIQARNLWVAAPHGGRRNRFGKFENPFESLADFLWRMNRDCRPLGKPVAF